ncbi:MAG TPA: exonuclease domain-containing protein [Solirubrobacteraceae bacterium]
MSAADRYARAKLPGRRTRWRAARWCALDFELTGLDPKADEIISFGAIPIEDGRVRLREAISGLVRPEREIGEASIRVHGIRASEVARAPVLAEALPPLLDTLAGRVIVAHTAFVERRFLSRALRARGLKLRGPIVDTEALGRLWLQDRERHSPRSVPLALLAGALGLPAERPHQALGDALTTAQVFIALATHLDADGRETVGSLARAGLRADTMRALHSG